MKLSSRAFSAALLALTTPALATVTVTSPTSGATTTSPVNFVASGVSTTCARGVASMGVYVDYVKTYVAKGSSLNTEITMSPGSHLTTVEEWDYCGGATVTHIPLTIEATVAPSVTITANSTTITGGSSTILTVNAVNASVVNVSGSDGSIYKFGATGGTQVVSPTATTTYTAEASGSGPMASAHATVTVIPASSLQSVSHVIFMLQENHSFDNYFGMLNPYRAANGWNIGDDGVTYNVDGIDDKLASISNKDDEGTTYDLSSSPQRALTI